MTFFCLAPVKNEAWILDRFIRCAAVWADHIVIADQGSTDDTVAIAQRHEKVTLVHNRSGEYSEAGRQTLLIDTARTIPCNGPRVFFALDADEMLSAELPFGPEWQRIQSAPPGTVIMMQWANLLPGMNSIWLMPKWDPFGYVDDGAPHTGRPIHSPRVPVRPESPVLRLTQGKVVHYQFAARDRMRAKQRWYQCWETLKFPNKRAVPIFRQYHNIDAMPASEVVPLEPSWLDGYEQRGIKMRDVPGGCLNWWDRDIVGLIAQFGAARFAKLDIWNTNWQAVAASVDPAFQASDFADPRTRFARAVHWWLRRTQARSLEMRVRAVQWVLRVFGW